MEEFDDDTSANRSIFGILALLFAATYAHAKKQPWQAELGEIPGRHL